jgi:diaminohydroxyphosphoribosylaminopyrimidine deaminase/5-amino-6-(5-phosphoribosylamino)uracil reductase
VTDEAAMQEALRVAGQALGVTRPNPAVGAVIVRDGVVLGAGYTQPPGGHHAEVMALRAARDAGLDVRGATLFVTLEPCCHHGRTPPCTDAILAAGIARVVVGVVDPFEPMQGRSLALLSARGVEVRLGVLAAACADQMRGFLNVISTGLPEVNLKVASTADGRLAAADGTSQWITGPAARREVHAQRAAHDAVLIGAGTALADDPSLDARGVGARAQPVPVVWDTELRWLRARPGAKLVRRAVEHGAPLVVCCADDLEASVLAELPAEVARAVVRVPVSRGSGGLDAVAALRALARMGLHRIWVEGGAALYRSLLDADVVDRVHLFLAGMALPGGASWVGGPPVAPIDAARRWGKPEVEVVGDDVHVVWTLRPAPGGASAEGGD